jgi:hypothetical protein
MTSLAGEFAAEGIPNTKDTYRYDPPGDLLKRG